MVGSDFQLRTAFPRDEEQIHQLFCVPEVYEFLADGEEPPPSIAAEWVASPAGDQARPGGGLWVLVGKTSPRVEGLVRLAGDDKGELELTYLLHPQRWGLGLATRMAHTVMTHAFETKSVSTIWAGADAPNQASIAVMKRLGMRFRREVQYPMGRGMEFEITAETFDPARIEPLPLT